MGWDSKDGMTCEECAEILGMKPEDVRQIEKAALQKLRNWARKGKCRPLQVARTHYLDRKL
jgi:DNA-directed RNA polymerase sigma subunit (sigma70/sigma32)